MSNTNDIELSLEVHLFAGKTPPQPLSMNFDPDGGSIGRRSENTWVLPDPERFVSGQHALISYHDGQYYLTDTSINGVFLNRSPSPIGKGVEAALQDGDTLLIGDYEIGVSVQQRQTAGLMQPDEFSDPFAGLSQEVEQSDLGSTFPNASHSGEKREPPAQSFELNPTDSEPLLPGEQEALFPEAHSNQVTEPDNTPDLEQAYQQSTPIPEDWDQNTDFGLEQADASSQPAIFPDLNTEPVTPQAPQPVQIPPSPPTAEPLTESPPQAPADIGTAGSEGPLRAALARGLGIPEDRLGKDSMEALLENLGRVTRTSLEGTMGVLRARAEIKGEFRMSQTMIKPVENNPLKFSVSIDEALPHLVNPTSNTGYLPPLRSVFEANEDIEAHMLAVMAGMQAALKAVLKRFEPAVLEERLGQSAILHNLPMYKHAKTWDLFTELYTEIAHEAEDDFHQLFGETFAQAYEEQVRRIEMLKRERLSRQT